jgi:hypothetical protein
MLDFSRRCQMIPYVQSLGESIERSWRVHSYDEEMLPLLALDTLKSCPPVEHVDIGDIVNWAFSSPHVFRQPNDRQLFGEPPVMLYQSPRFYIEALFWFSATTEIHEHAFSGAFAVLAGSSVHSQWRFSPERSINSRMLCGQLCLEHTEVLRPGDMRQIYSGCRLIHQLFHLEMPSVTLVIRTYEDRHHLPQYKYVPPGLAIDPENHEGLRTRRLMLLDGMARGTLDGLWKYGCRLIEEDELESIFYLFSILTRRNVERVVLDDLYNLAQKRHGNVIDLFRQACEVERRTRVIVARRSRISDPSARFLLALLMLMPNRDSIFAAVGDQFPGADPLETIENCLGAISGQDTIGIDFSDANKIIFRGLVEGLDEEDLLQRLRSEFRGDSISAHRERLLEHAMKLARSDLFSPLFSESPFREARVYAFR